MTVSEFLSKIAQLESSNNTDIEHKEMSRGIHKGDSAIGKYGLMPNTIKEFINRRKVKHGYGPDELVMDKMNKDGISNFIPTNTRIEENLAKDIANHVMMKSDNDSEKAAYMWNVGHNKNPSSITDDDLNNSEYIKRFRKLNNLIDKE